MGGYDHMVHFPRGARKMDTNRKNRFAEGKKRWPYNVVLLTEDNLSLDSLTCFY
jgi:hypothetical protein